MRKVNNNERVDELVESNLPLVWAVIKRFFPMDYREEAPYGGGDVYGSGCLGLVKAAMRFDESKGVKFSTYAFSLMRGEINNFKRDNSSIIKLPREVYETRGRVYERESKNPYIKTEHICSEFGLSSLEVKQMKDVSKIVSLDQSPLGEGLESLSLVDTVKDTSDYIEDMMRRHEKAEKMEIYKKLLNENQFHVLVCIVESNGRNDNRAIGEIVGVTTNHVSRTIRRITEMAPYVDEIHKGVISIERAKENIRAQRKSKSLAV